MHRRKSGIPPVIPQEAEADLVVWIVEMSKRGFPVDGKWVLSKANLIFKALYPRNGFAPKLPPLDKHWLTRFKRNHPNLSWRKPQVVCNARLQLTFEDLQPLFDCMSKLVIGIFLVVCTFCVVIFVLEHDITDPSRIFNVDETAISPDMSTKKVLVTRGTRDVAKRMNTQGYHVTLLVCAAASGTFMPPLVIFPGLRLTPQIAEACNIPGATFTTTGKGWITGAVFANWLHIFNQFVIDQGIQKPVVLMLDGAPVHISAAAIDYSTENNIVLLCSTPNATHIIQPLDVSVFGPFKNCLRDAYAGTFSEKGIVSKEQCMSAISSAWNTGMIAENIQAGFKATGLFPLCHAMLQHRFKQFISAEKEIALPWITVEEHVRKNILVVPEEIMKPPSRKTVTVGARILSAADILDDCALKRKAIKPKKVLQRKKHKLSDEDEYSSDWE